MYRGDERHLLLGMAMKGSCVRVMKGSGVRVMKGSGVRAMKDSGVRAMKCSDVLGKEFKFHVGPTSLSLYKPIS